MKITLILAVVAASACASIPRATVRGQLADAWSQVSSREYVRVRGIGVVDPLVRGLTRRRAHSRNAAIVAARYNLLALIRGVKLEGGVSVSQLMERDSLIAEIANDVVKGGEEALTEWTTDGGCVVTLELKRSTVERLIKQKSQHEKDLEARVARDIVEIERLKNTIEWTSMDPKDKADLAVKSARAKLIVDKVNEAQEGMKHLDPQGGPETSQTLGDMADALVLISDADHEYDAHVLRQMEKLKAMAGAVSDPYLYQDIVTKSEPIEDRHDRESEVCWIPFSRCWLLNRPYQGD